MKNKKIIIIVMFMLILITLTEIAYAASASITLTSNKTTLKQGDEIEINISIKNLNIDAGIEDISGYLIYDKNIFELIDVDVEDEIENLNLSKEKQEILEEYAGMLDVLDLTEKYIVAGAEENGNYIISIVSFSTDGIIPKTSTDVNVGKIRFKVLNNVANKATSIKINELYANGEEKLDDAVTNQINIGTQVSNQITTNNSTTITTPNSANIGVIMSTTNTNKNSASTNNNANNVSLNKTSNKVATQETQQAKEKLSDAGTEQTWPILLVIGFSSVLYINYRRFKEIDEK
ncbi:MAG: cohesin domain-containing protein [Candidatus Scatovivens sp.]